MAWFAEFSKKWLWNFLIAGWSMPFWALIVASEIVEHNTESYLGTAVEWNLQGAAAFILVLNLFNIAPPKLMPRVRSVGDDDGPLFSANFSATLTKVEK